MADRITIKDIAKALSIHHSTVSRALRNDERVKEATRKKVNDYAKEHGYQINMIALELRGEKRNTIAIIVPNVNHQFFSNIISYITNYASDSGFVVSVFQSNENYKQELSIINTIIQHNFAGVVASISMESKDTFHFNKLKEHDIPLVMFDRVSDDINVSKVMVNNAEVMHEAVTILHKKGRNKIVHVSGPKHLNVFSERQRGYNTAIDRLGLEYKNTIIIEKGFSVEDGQGIVDTLFDGELLPDAIISDSSNLLYGLLKALRLRGVSVPEDVALIAYGENPILDIMQPSITSIEQPDMEIAETAFKLLNRKMNNDNDTQTESITLSAKINIRESI